MRIALRLMQLPDADAAVQEGEAEQVGDFKEGGGVAAEPALVLNDAHVVFTELFGVTVGAGEQLEVGERDLRDGEALV